MPMLGRKVRRWAGILSALYALFLAAMTLRPVGTGAIDVAVDSLGRGYLHLPAYAVLGALLATALGSNRLRRLAGAFGLAVLFGAALEVGQIAVPTRHFNWLGIGLNTAGAALGCLAAGGFGRRVARDQPSSARR